ncbi:TonB-dependent siderophore receptor [Paraburkholderia rhizosphaerae]|uniref:Iron complex outermembrane receptor protein n=1 Tax=Paraburkholderia rhizosphaerae TaxID=480658 RepID=A0A4R8LYF2_9BURK|nr:TonB-dependent receptor [Paraburkholderia rhizosphaerae]TDY53427.1 iron complex outermembrane receptor protein [Paraburkholderia rhizosphaerae]
MHHAEGHARSLRSIHACNARLAVKPTHLAVLFAIAAAPPAVFAQQQPSVDATADAAEKALPAVRITASQDAPLHLDEDVSSGALGTRSQLDTPFSTTIVTDEQLQEMQPAKLGEVFMRDASVSDNSNPYNAWASYLTVRGMQLDWQNAFKIDGLPFNAYGITMPYEQLESVQLLKGLSGFMYGFGAPGGIVNYVTKKPPRSAKFFGSVDVGYQTDGIWSQHVDLGGRVGPNDMFGYRLNATHEEGQTYNDGHVRRNAVSLALDARLTRDLTATFGLLWQERHATGITSAIYTAQFPGLSLPPPVSGGSPNLSGPDQHLNTNLQWYTAGLRYNLTPDWTASLTYGYSNSSRDRNEGTFFLQNYLGNYNDFRFAGKEGNRLTFWQAMVEGNVKTGPFAHQLVFGAAYQKQINDYEVSSFYDQIGTGNLYQPNTNVFFSPEGLSSFPSADIIQKSLFASDTIQLTERWSVLGGVRYTNYEQNGYALDGSTTSTYSKNGVLTPTVALMFKLARTTTLYASYVQSLEPGSIVAPTYANGGALLSPIRSKQYEVGVKSEHERWSATAALFRIERGAEYPNSANVYVQDGEQIFQGVEAGADVRLGRDWTVGGDLMWIDTKYERGAANVGNRVAGAPKFVGAAYVSYAVPAVPGLRLGVDAKYTGNTEVRPAGGLQTGGYLLVNAGASYLTRIGGHDVTLRASVDNLFNRRYWMFQYADYVGPGDPRTLSLNARFDF